MNEKTVAGVDMAKASFVAEIWTTRARQKEFPNNADGFLAFLQWAHNAGASDQMLILIEATGRYGDAFSAFMKLHGHDMRIANPKRIRRFGEALGLLNKTDEADAHAIAEFARHHADTVPVWVPKTAARQMLADLRCHIAGLEKSIKAMTNRLESGIEMPFVVESLQRLIREQEKELAMARALASEVIENDTQLRRDKEILMSQISVKEVCATIMLTRIDFRSFKSARQVAKFAGLTPRREQSGTSLNKNGRISKEGPSDVRAKLFMAAGSAVQHDPVMRDFADRLRTRGKPGRLINAAVMRKILMRSWSLVVNQREYDVAYAPM